MRSCVQRRSGSGSVSFRACLPRLLPRGASGGTPRLVFCPGQGEALAPDVLCRIDVGVGLVPAVPAFKPALRPPVGGVDRPALGAGPAGIHGRDGYEGAAVPPALVLELCRMRYQPWKRMDRLRPAFCLTLEPGLSTVPFADFTMLRVRVSSMATTLWSFTSWEVMRCWRPLRESWRFCSTRRSWDKVLR